MRTFIAFIFCLYMLVPTFAIAQQEESCDANPRWLLVTVVASKFWIKSDSDDEPRDQYYGGKLELVDRCDITSISPYEDTADKRSIATEILKMFRSETGEIISWSRLWVKESLQDICQSMQDCADVTSRP